MKDGIRMKYILHKADGSPVDSEACYFVLKLNGDKPHHQASRTAMRVYAECIEEDLPELANDIMRCLDWLDNPPACTCGGGRDMDVTCPFHNGGYFRHPVWRHGGEA